MFEELLLAADGEFLGSNPGYILFGKLRYLFERGLKLPVVVVDLGIGRIWWNLDFSAHPHERFRKWLGDHEVIPRVENPRMIEGNVKSHHRQSGGS